MKSFIIFQTQILMPLFILPKNTLSNRMQPKTDISLARRSLLIISTINVMFTTARQNLIISFTRLRTTLDVLMNLLWSYCDRRLRYNPKARISTQVVAGVCRDSSRKNIMQFLICFIIFLSTPKIVESNCRRLSAKTYSCADICDARFRRGIDFLEVRNTIADLRCAGQIPGLKVSIFFCTILLYFQSKTKNSKEHYPTTKESCIFSQFIVQDF